MVTSRVLISFTVLAVMAVSGRAAPVRVGHVEAELIAESTAIQPGQRFTVALRLQADEHWHTYWRNPGDSGQPTTIAWTLPPGFVAGAIQWPVPTRLATGPLISYGYEGEVLLLTEITAPANLDGTAPIILQAHAEWLVCSDQCVPGDAKLALEMSVSPHPGAIDPARAATFAAARRALPAGGAEPWSSSYAVAADDITLEIGVPADGNVTANDVYFFPAVEGVIEASAPQAATLENGRLIVRLKKSGNATTMPATIAGVLMTATGTNQAVTIVASRGAATGAKVAASTATFIGTILSAFLGGLILNLMPCVFPVLGVKILGFVNQAGHDRRKVTLHGLIFTTGVLISFWALAGALIALRAGGQQLGWGFQLQSPAFVFGLAVFLLAFALNLSGVFEFGLAATGVGGSLQMRSGYSGSFFTGVLATVVSTPCAAPFLAPALGAALALPALQALILFTVIGLGLSTPYLVLSAFPRLIKGLPRPGAWMETFKQFMAFPLYATVAFLVWVLAGQIKNEDVFLKVLAGFVLVALALWGYGRWTQNGAAGRRRVLGYAFAGLCLAAGLVVGFPRNATSPWQEWRPGLAEKLRAEGKVVYVDFTARWCATCKVNKLAVFSSAEVEQAFVRDGVVRLKADWTNRDPEITQALAAYGRSAVPFNLVYAPNLAEPILLPEVLTPGVVLEALHRAGAPAVALGR